MTATTTIGRGESAGDVDGHVLVTDLRVAYGDVLLGLGDPTPSISWRIETTRANWRQLAYEIRFMEPGSSVSRSTGRIESDASVHVEWPFPPMESRQRASIAVRVWGVDGSASEFSPELSFEMGLLRAADWTAELVLAVDAPADTTPVLFRRDFDIPTDVVRARLFISAYGVFEAEINGVAVSDDVLAPGWTSYEHRLRYLTYDVTTLVREGDNAIGVTVADGWFRGHLGFEGGVTELYGQRTALLAQLEVEAADGTRTIVTSDADWAWMTGPIVSTGLYAGEVRDARRERAGWSRYGFTEATGRVETVKAPTQHLVAPSGPPVRATEELPVIEVLRTPSGATILDFGQVISGRVRFRITADAGHRVTLRHAEVLEHGELGTRPLRAARAEDGFIAAGTGVESFEPRFTTHGFRYVEVEGWPGPLDPADFSAIVLHTDMRRTGWFESSDPVLNRLHENVVWSMRGNFVDIPTDCPQRDERLGWTGDIQIFTPTASFLFDCNGFLASWLQDLAAEQRANGGAVPNYVPYIDLLFPIESTAAWADAATLIPDTLHERFADTSVLLRQYESMRSHVEHVSARCTDGVWRDDFQFGDWLDPSAPPDDPARAMTDPALVATAFIARSTEVVASAAARLGFTADARRFAELAQAHRAAFQREFVTPRGRLASDSATAYALAIRFDLLAPAQIPHAVARLRELTQRNGFRIQTGFVGTPIICDALAGNGESDVAYHLLMERQCPSWLYPVLSGATTIWERWDSMLPNGEINPGEMTSFNHYALGSVADFMHRVIGGISPMAPGYREVSVHPVPGGGLTSCTTRHDTPYGTIAVAWSRESTFTMTVDIPPQVTAHVTLPDGIRHVVGSGRHTFASDCRAASDDPMPPYPPHWRDFVEGAKAAAARRRAERSLLT